ncbi:MAG: hypothetical protein ACRDLS_11995 [Solirubrobacteraceae bacterium]
MPGAVAGTNCSDEGVRVRIAAAGSCGGVQKRYPTTAPGGGLGIYYA